MTTTDTLPDSGRHAATFWTDQVSALGTTPCLPSGYAELDLLLPGGGWPAGTLSEIYVERSGIGELQLLMPAAATLTQDGRGLAMLNPPTQPYTPALAARGVQLQHVLILRSQPDDKQVATSEQLLFSGNCGMLLLWHDHLQEQVLHRLKHAAERSGALVVLYRSRRAQPFSGAVLRLHVSRKDGRTVVNVLKRQNGGTPPPVQLDMHGSLTRRPPTWHLPLLAADQPRLQHTH